MTSGLVTNEPRKGWTARTAAAEKSRSRNTAGFVSFVFLTALMFLRPGDMFPSLQWMRLYWVGSGACLIFLHREVIEQLRPSILMRHPLTLCVLAIMGAAVLSLVLHGDLYDARVVAFDCFVSGLYYLFLIGTIDTTRRLRIFLIWLVVLILSVTALGLLQYNGYIDVNARPYVEEQDYLDPSTGQPVILSRLCAIGIYDNPNDLARVLVIGSIICLYFVFDRRLKGRRIIPIAALGLLGHALHLTYSRGGFLALLAGVGAMFYLRFGKMRTLVVALIALPLLFILFAGRITDLTTSEGTGQDRIQLWRDAFEEMKSAPIFGIGVGNLEDKIGLLAHNSFVQCYAEMGLFGGTIFAATFYLAIWAPLRLKRDAESMPDIEMRRQREVLIAVMTGAVVGMFSSTRGLKIETYMLLGMVGAYLQIMERRAPWTALKLNLPLSRRLAVAGMSGLVFFYVYVRFAAR